MLVASKEQLGFDFLFLAYVNIVVMRSTLLLCGAPEAKLAALAFRGAPVVSVSASN